jgi:hypothetical protein
MLLSTTMLNSSTYHWASVPSKFLTPGGLNDHWTLYENLMRDGDQIPELDKETYEATCNMIEELFRHINHQQKLINQFEGEVMGSLSSLKNEVAGFKNRKRRVVGSEPKRTKGAKRGGSGT